MDGVHVLTKAAVEQSICRWMLDVEDRRLAVENNQCRMAGVSAEEIYLPLEVLLTLTLDVKSLALS